MKTRQKSVRVFEIISDDYDKVVSFVEKKSPLLKRYLLVVKTNNEKIKNYFDGLNFEVRFVNNDFETSDEELETDDTKVKIVEKVVEKIIYQEVNSTKPEIFDKIIRSGEDIKRENKLVFLERINAGAKVYSTKEIEIFDEVLGEVTCNGEYMIVKKAKKGRIIFNNEVIDEIKTLSFISKKGIKEII